MLYRSALPPDVVLLHTSLPRAGRVSLGAEVNVLPAAVEAVRARGGLVIAQLDPDVPYVFGDGELSVEQVDWAIEAIDPLGVPASTPVDEVAAGIADRVSSGIPRESARPSGHRAELVRELRRGD